MNPEKLNEIQEPEYLNTLYKEIGTQNRYLLDWRHKVLVRFFLSVAAVLLIAKWIWENDQNISHFWIFIPFGLISILSLVFYIMDKRDRQFLDLCTQIGSNLEKQMKYENGFFSMCLKTTHLEKKGELKSPLFSFTTSVKIMYFGTAGISALIALIVLITNWK